MSFKNCKKYMPASLEDLISYPSQNITVVQEYRRQA
jgi:hypothetical protein